MNLRTDCLEALKYPTFWSDIDAPSLRKFLDFRHLEGSEVGQKVLKLKSDFEVFVFNVSFFDSWNARTTLQVECLHGLLCGWYACKGKVECSVRSSFWVESSYGQLVGGMLTRKGWNALEVNKTLWNLRNICIESELADEKSKLQWKEGMLEFEKTGLRHLQETSSAVQEKQILSYTSYVSSETQTNNVKDKEASENLRYNTSPKYICKVPLPKPFLVNQQGKKHGFETEEDGEEYDADLTIVGGKSVEWIVNGIHIRERFKEYQLKENLPKTRPEYYDIIFFNSNKDGFLETLDESIVTQMLSDISEREPENTVENEIKLLLNHIIDRDIKKKNKGKLKQVKEEDTALFENKFALYFVRLMVRLMEDINLLLDPMSEGTYVSRVLAPILDEFFVKNKDSGVHLTKKLVLK
ncbi:hypothetical protein F8M41_024237 [Gigaspora margarita]|uniref:Uncharacterized protein n=1 Tax=Gigaspora margarita TaxID=4874 RepID=A0A8H4EG64_GIGMA|nr:hypothetical protein F8M41_024237 [Gigaspora margarita]